MIFHVSAFFLGFKLVARLRRITRFGGAGTKLRRYVGFGVVALAFVCRGCGDDSLMRP